jgi:2',3'-cyclic-nucleotide 2'-phosphodiesterase
MPTVKILFFADVVGKAGRFILSQMTRRLKYFHGADYAIANIENAAGGFGITPEMSRKVFAYGIDCQTSGNHIWDRPGIGEFMLQEERLIRPANYPDGAPGHGYYIGKVGELPIAVINLMGRTYMYDIECPFRTADRILDEIKNITNLIIIDFHAEATSEKQALLYYLDGRVSAIVGTHTHVQTADEHISSRGTAFIGDCGMTGAFDSILGMNKGPALGRFLTGMPKRLSAAENDVRISGVVVELQPDMYGRAVKIERFSMAVDLSLPLRNPEEEEVLDAGDGD